MITSAKLYFLSLYKWIKHNSESHTQYEMRRLSWNKSPSFSILCVTVYTDAYYLFSPVILNVSIVWEKDNYIYNTTVLRYKYNCTKTSNSFVVEHLHENVNRKMAQSLVVT
jgi:hypothetical protein